MKLRRRAWLVASALALLAARADAAPSDEGDEQALAADAEYALGLAALKANDHAGALAHFLDALKRFPDAANLHNELGFTFRKLGRLDKAFEHYKRALAIDPRHRGAHEYIGEAYLQDRKPAEAEKHLGELEKICGNRSCEEYADLSKAIAEYKAKN